MPSISSEATCRRRARAGSAARSSAAGRTGRAGSAAPRAGALHDHLDDGRRQPDDALDARQQLHRRGARPSPATRARGAGCAAGSSAAISSANSAHHVRVAVLRRRHRLDDVAGVARVVVAVVGDELAVVLYEVKKPFASGSSAKLPSASFDRAEALEELLPAVELERARVLFLVGDVGRGAGGDAAPCAPAARRARRRRPASRAREAPSPRTWPNSSGIASTGSTCSRRTRCPPRAPWSPLRG